MQLLHIFGRPIVFLLRYLAIFSLSLSLIGCTRFVLNADDGNPKSDIGSDSAFDSRMDSDDDVLADVLFDIKADSFHDAGVDSIVDVGVDRPLDLPIDTAVDVNIDTTIDMSVDIGIDIGIDLSSTDLSIDTTIDTGSTISALCQTQVEIPAIECAALEALYHSTDGANWSNHTDWTITATPCSWYGVTCASGHVTELNLNSNQLKGPIPSEIGDLVSLQRLFLGANQLSGSMPSELGRLSNLNHLNLHANQLTGSIPSALGNLSNLMFIALGENNLTGTIPSKVGGFLHLTELYLQDNQLTGMSSSTLLHTQWLIRAYLDTNLFDQAGIDRVIAGAYTDRMLYNLAPSLTLETGNASPSGNYSDPSVTPGNGSSNSDWSWNGSCHIPLSAKAMIYALQNDNCSEGFKTWTISYTP